MPFSEIFALKVIFLRTIQIFENNLKFVIFNG